MSLVLAYNKSLTRQNAAQHGYQWVMDILPDTAQDCVQNIPYLIAEDGYILGQPSTEQNEESCFGFYEPLQTPQEKKYQKEQK